MFDVVTGATAYARNLKHQDHRVKVELSPAGCCPPSPLSPAPTTYRHHARRRGHRAHRE
jgi:hypothetical protein